MDLSRSRIALQAAITAYANAQTTVTAAVAAIELQRTTLASAEAELAKFSDLDRKSASVAASRAKAKATGQWREDAPYEDGSTFGKVERNLRSMRNQKRRAEERIADERAALTQLIAERDEALRDATNAAIDRTEAIEAVMVEEGVSLLARAQEAENFAAGLRAELHAMDGLWISVAGMTKPRLLLSGTAGKDIANYLRSPLPASAPSHAQKAQWKALMKLLESDAEASIGDEAVTAAAAEINPPAAPVMPPQVRWEEGAEARAQAVLAAQVRASSPHGTGVAPMASEPKFEDSEAYKMAWKKPNGEPLNVRFEDSPAYVAQRRGVV
jgi:hypothetical protein